jgi:hypothetical protein
VYNEQDICWEGDSPYDKLAPSGITPKSSMEEIDDSMGYFIEHDMLDEIHDTWNKLLLVKERLFIDFFLYRKEQTYGNSDG